MTTEQSHLRELIENAAEEWKGCPESIDVPWILSENTAWESHQIPDPDSVEADELTDEPGYESLAYLTTRAIEYLILHRWLQDKFTDLERELANRLIENS